MTAEAPERIAPALLTILQVCQLLNISRAKFYRLDQTGKFAPLTTGLGRKRLYDQAEIENWIRAGLPHRKNGGGMKKDLGVVKNIKIQNFQVIFGDVKTENVQTGDHININKYTAAERNKKSLAKKPLEIIAAIVSFLASLLTCLYYLGWLE